MYSGVEIQNLISRNGYGKYDLGMSAKKGSVRCAK